MFASPRRMPMIVFCRNKDLVDPMLPIARGARLLSTPGPTRVEVIGSGDPRG